MCPVLNERSFKAVGKALPRNEDRRLVTGRGRFSDDFAFPGQVWAAMVRSPHPHARIAGIDTAEAMAMPGVLGVFTGADIQTDGLRPIPHNPVPSTNFDLKLRGRGGIEVFIGPHYLLPADKARHVGEAVAMVIAQTLGRRKRRPSMWRSVTRCCRGWRIRSRPRGPKRRESWDELPDNILVDSTFGDVAATDAAFAGARHVVSYDFHIGRVTGVPLEPRAALGNFDAETGRYTVYAGSGGRSAKSRSWLMSSA